MEEKTPIIPKKIELKDEGNEIYEIIEEKVYTIKHNNENYLLNISKTNKESILFNLKLDKEFITEYYQKNYKLDSLKKKSEIFLIYGTLEESYSVIIENLEENNAKEVNIEFSKNCAKIIFGFKLLLNKKKTIFFELTKKEVNISSILNTLNDKIINFQGNQAQLEGKIIEIDELLNKKKAIENELKIKIEEISKIKNAQNDLEKSIMESKVSIKEISKEQKDIFTKIEEISSKNTKLAKKYDEINENLSKNDKKYLELNESIKSFQKLLEKTNDEIDLIKKNQEFIKSKVEEKEKEYDLMTKRQSKYEETFKYDIKQLTEEINFLKTENSELKKKFEEIGKNEEKKEKEEDEYQKIQEIEKYLKSLNKEKKENYEEEDDKLKNDPYNFKYDELISQDLFKENFYNNRACIFTSFKDKKI